MKKELQAFFKDVKTLNIKSKLTNEKVNELYNEVKNQLINQGCKDNDIVKDENNTIKVKNNNFIFFIGKTYDKNGSIEDNTLKLRSKDIIIDGMYVNYKDMKVIINNVIYTKNSIITKIA